MLDISKPSMLCSLIESFVFYLQRIILYQEFNLHGINNEESSYEKDLFTFDASTSQIRFVQIYICKNV